MTVTEAIQQQIKNHEITGPYHRFTIKLDQQNYLRLKLLCEGLDLSQAQAVALLLPPAIEEALAVIGVTYP